MRVKLLAETDESLRELEMNRTILAVLAIGCSLGPCCLAQNKAEASGIAGLAHIALRVSDVDREVTFFGKMGFEEAFADTKDGHTTQAFVKINDRQYFEVLAVGGPTQPAGFLNAGYESADLNTLNARYAAAGLNPSAVQKGGAGNLIFLLNDPDGRETAFTQYLPGSRQMNDKGQHLGVRRISEQLLGIEMPVKDMKATQKFYELLGFDAENVGAELRLSIPANPELSIELHPAHAKDEPEFLLAITDAHMAADDLHAAGLKYERRDKVVFVRDPDGNSFVLVEPVEESKHHGGISWHRKSNE